VSGSALLDVRTSSIRVALTATALVGAVYLAIAAAVVLIVTGSLTAQVDARLTDALARIGPDAPAPPRGFDAPEPRRPFGPVTIVWTVQADGTVVSNTASAVLPDAYRAVVGPVTISTQNAELRVRGTARGNTYIVVGETMDPVMQAQDTIVVAELIIGPILLAIMFLGAVAIGRRVAAPIEHARHRQLDFTADASHELRTPLSVIEAQTSLALMQDRDAVWYRAAFERVGGESRRMRRLLDDLLWLARFDTPRGQAVPEPVDLGVLATQAADRFAIVAQSRRLTFAVHEAPGPCIVAGPAEWLDRLVGVLLDNACKYSPEGGEVTLTVAAAGSHVRLSVDDSGPGIPVEERETIFDRFHRSTDAAGGSGLGLAIADAIVTTTNGRWRIGTSAAGGASMSVTWPAALRGRHADAESRRP
jgi:two-component system, OmpR family, sensor histidine kinase CiaH